MNALMDLDEKMSALQPKASQRSHSWTFYASSTREDFSQKHPLMLTMSRSARETHRSKARPQRNGVAHSGTYVTGRYITDGVFQICF